jgi:pimeloyl-ACP methyl ester carboxylesterase
MGRRFLTVTICLLLLLAMASSMPAMAKGKPDKGKSNKDLYKVVTEDGVTLAVKRYRPNRAASFRSGGQPIVMWPGLMSNMNEFDFRTPPGETYDVKLPDPLADWAQGDKYIQQDHMRYYSMAHYLWLQGYDVWMANYRGEGRDEYESGGAAGYSIDDLGIYDAPAVVTQVYKATGQHPIWFGHSMGSTIAIIYLQGAKYGEGEGYARHVVSDPALVAERNNGNGPQAIKAYIDMDGPMCPMHGEATNNALTWLALYPSYYFDFRNVMKEYAVSVAGPIVRLAGDWMWQVMKDNGFPDLGMLDTLVSINCENLDPSVFDFGNKYCFDGFSSRCVAQFADGSAYQQFRESYLNGNGWFYPPEPAPGDGFYYYSDPANLAKITIPALVLCDDRRDITNPDDICRLYDGKTRTSLDKLIREKNTAHVDLISGLNAPTETYPNIGNWLEELMASH